VLLHGWPGDRTDYRELIPLLDGCEVVVDGVASLAAELLAACPHLTVVVTSRVALSIGGEHVVRIEPFAEPAGADARALLASGPHGATDYIDADARDVGSVLEQAQRTLDFSQPVAAISLLTLHAISDEDDPHRIMARIMDAVPAGSYLAISHPASDIEPDRVTDLQTRVNQLSYQQYTGRSHDQVMRFFTGLELVEPGLVQVQQWRPGIPANGTLALWAGVGRKPD